MERSTLDLYKPDFWYVLVVAVLLLVPITWPVLRKWVWAAINLAFLGVLLGTTEAAYVGLAMLGTCIVLQAIQRRWVGALPLALASLTVLALFLIHKLPALESL